jgi:uncharacterized glyoxalase superfamily protein PhnB
MQSIYPVLKYADARAAIEFLERAFGFERIAVYDADGGAVAHAELRFGEDMVMLGSTGQGDPSFDAGAGKTSLYLVVDDPDARYQRAKDAGAGIQRELEEMDYGSREFTALDPEGNRWSFGTYRPKGEG